MVCRILKDEEMLTVGRVSKSYFFGPLRTSFGDMEERERSHGSFDKHECDGVIYLFTEVMIRVQPGPLSRDWSSLLEPLHCVDWSVPDETTFSSSFDAFSLIRHGKCHLIGWVKLDIQLTSDTENRGAIVVFSIWILTFDLHKRDPGVDWTLNVWVSYRHIQP